MTADKDYAVVIIVLTVPAIIELPFILRQGFTIVTLNDVSVIECALGSLKVVFKYTE